jgi:hypothetical protein
MIDFKPSQVVIIVPPLVATMGRAESEHAATLLVLACATKGDTWGPIQPEEVGKAIHVALEERREPWHSLNRNPFFKPDFYELVSKGFARWTQEEGKGPIAFTDKGLERLRRWVRSDAEHEPAERAGFEPAGDKSPRA